jgi:hypothetical protein
MFTERSGNVQVSAWLIGPIWIFCWLAFCGLPVSLALAPLTLAPLPYFLALYLVLAVVQRPLLCMPIPRIVHLEPASQAKKPALNLMHPHGALCHGVHTVMASLTRRSVLLTPLWPVVYPLLVQCNWTSASISARSISALMREERDMWLYPGGFIEAARHSYHTDVVDVGSRGAARLALRHGYPIRVAFAFGERKTACNVQGLWGIRLWLAKHGVPAVVPWHFRLFGKSPIRVVVSRTIDVPLVPVPTDADVERLHAEYVGALIALHAANKGPDDPPLVVFGVQKLCNLRSERGR